MTIATPSTKWPAYFNERIETMGPDELRALQNERFGPPVRGKLGDTPKPPFLQATGKSPTWSSRDAYVRSFARSMSR